MNDRRLLLDLKDEINEAHGAKQTAAADAAGHILAYIAAINVAHGRLPLDEWRVWLGGLDEPIDRMYEVVSELLEITTPGAVFEVLTRAQRELANWMLELRAN